MAKKRTPHLGNVRRNKTKRHFLLNEGLSCSRVFISTRRTRYAYVCMHASFISIFVSARTCRSRTHLFLRLHVLADASIHAAHFPHVKVRLPVHLDDALLETQAAHPARRADVRKGREVRHSLVAFLCGLRLRAPPFRHGGAPFPSSVSKMYSKK